MKIEVTQSWRPFNYIVSIAVGGKKLTYEGTQNECQQIATDLRKKINRSGAKKNLTVTPAVANL